MAMAMRVHYRVSVVLAAATMVAGIAVLAATNLWYLRRVQSQNVHAMAAQSALDFGVELARHLAAQPVVSRPAREAGQWDELSRLVRSLKRVEPTLQYVSVSEGGVLVFHDDMSVGITNAANGGIPKDADAVRVGRTRLDTGRAVVPVMTFTAPVPAGGGARRVEIALLKDVVTRREEQAARALAIMFRLSLATLIAAFAVAVVFVGWFMRHELERERRRRAQEHLAFAGTLADGIIHDVRNPMSSLRLDLQMLEKETGRGADLRIARIAELAGRARRTMDRVDAVMREFLYVSRPEPSVRERVDLNGCVRDCADLLGPRFEAAGVHLLFEMAPGPIDVLGFGVGIKRALINVLTNAKQVSPKGGTVTVRTGLAGGRGFVQVDDEGPGIPKETASRMFDMFVTYRQGGTGLGLHLARAAVESSGGTIVAENRPEGGARFTLRLPGAPMESGAS
jgi:signal transduction histidine kinase